MKAQRFESIYQGANSPKTLASKKFSITGFYNDNDSSKKGWIYIHYSVKAVKHVLLVSFPSKSLKDSAFLKMPFLCRTPYSFPDGTA